MYVHLLECYTYVSFAPVDTYLTRFIVSTLSVLECVIDVGACRKPQEEIEAPTPA